VLFGLAAYVVALRPVILETRQVRNHGFAQHLAALVSQYSQSHGQLPKHLGELGGDLAATLAKDAWGNLFHFESRGEAFVLVSYGRDWRPDGTDYWALREQGDHPSGWRICGDFDRDEVVSDVGYLRICGK